MAQDDYFSFGDEDLEPDQAPADFAIDSGEPALALADRPETTVAEEVGFGSTVERAERPRGDSPRGSSERRWPSRRWTPILLAVLVGAVILAGVSALSGASDTAPGERSAAVKSVPAPSTSHPTRFEEIQANRQRAAERQRARQHRARTRQRARRRRERAATERRQHFKAATRAKLAAAPEVPEAEYVPPAYEPAPPSSVPAPPAEAPSLGSTAGGQIQDGASSPEFGL